MKINMLGCTLSAAMIMLAATMTHGQDSSVAREKMMQIAPFLGEWAIAGDSTPGSAASDTNKVSFKMSATGNTCIETWRSVDTTGKVLSEGEGMIYWDPATEKVSERFHGYRNGVFFEGFGTFTVQDDDSIQFNGSETSINGKITRYRSTAKFIGSHSMNMTVEDGDTGEKFEFTGKKRNMLAEALGPVTRLEGAWIWTGRNAQGQSETNRIEFGWGPAGTTWHARGTSEVDGKMSESWEETLAWDPTRMRVIGFYHDDANGFVCNEIGYEINEGRNGAEQWTISFTGQDRMGQTFTGTRIGRLLDRNSVTWDFGDVYMNGQQVDTSGWGDRRVFTRLAN
ncbi:MAG: hypothetical protein CMJ32_06235 [Phycisphaerae bacterium]|nr:hypothetical protein [Phycisphaerae bacterium]